MQAGIHCGLVAGFTAGRDAQSVVEELVRTAGSLLGITLFQRVRQLQQRLQAPRLGHHQIAQVAGQRTHEVQGVETLGQNLVQDQESRGIIPGHESVDQLEAVFVVQHVQVADHVFILDVGAAECHCLVEDGQGVAHGAVGLGSNHVQGFVVDGHPLLAGDAPQVPHHVRNADPVEVVGLAAAQDGGQDLVLLGGGQDKDGVCRRLLQRLQERIEGRLRQHVHLVDDIHAVLSHLRRYLHLLHQGLDVFHRIVGSGIQLMDAVRPALLEANAGLALPARLHLRPRVGAVDHLGKDARRGGLAHPARAAEQIGVGQLPPPDGVGQRPGDGILADQALEGIRPVLPGRHNILTHIGTNVHKISRLYVHL